MHPRVMILPETRADEAVAALTAAFLPDPIFSFYFPEAAPRARVFGAFFSDIIVSHLRFGHVYAAMLDGAIIGAAIWRPPDADEPTELDRERAIAAERVVRDVDNAAAEALFAGFASLEAGHPAAPHWYLFFTGIVPAWQGHGFGSALLAPVLNLADQSRVLCYLETPFPRTHRFYRRLGYEISYTGNPFVGAPTLWAMTRQPRIPDNSSDDAEH
ncbi:MAG TPA: GNAT family N-acetyltransferase [Stellaceae bacterium]|nr:GNAT family N-acetyltransferase [Stellaceae bacterium]